jgi:hypothetical protein
MNKKFVIKLLGCLFLFICNQPFCWAQKNYGTLVLKFQYTANGKILTLKDSNYVNAFGENYAITRLKFYISNISLSAKAKSNWGKEVFLLDASTGDSVKIKAFPGVYSNLNFTIGVDSILNCSGAQDGSLDPLNGMFWTWNSGYVFFKLEGYSSSSTADLHRIEHHIGGYQGINKAARPIKLALQQSLKMNEDDHKTITIMVDLDKYWKGETDIIIASNALIMVPGELAKKSADNLPDMFSIIESK